VSNLREQHEQQMIIQPQVLQGYTSPHFGLHWTEMEKMDSVI